MQNLVVVFCLFLVFVFDNKNIAALFQNRGGGDENFADDIMAYYSGAHPLDLSNFMLMVRST